MHNKFIFYFEQLKVIFLKFQDDRATFGIQMAFLNLLCDNLFPSKNRRILLLLRNKRYEYIYKFLVTKYSDIINFYQTTEVKIGINQKKIWCLWWQGIEDAPPLVKKCIKNIEKYSGDYEVIILTEENYSNYADIPLEIMEKVYSGKISFTHFSDILRARLLSLYGGIWIDSTVLICEDVFKEFNQKTFNTAFLTKGEWMNFLTKGKWCGFFMGGKPNKLFSFLYDMLIQYNLDYDYLINYFLIDYIIKIAYDSFKECEVYIDNATLKNQNIFYFDEFFSKTYKNDEFRELCDKYKFFKLSYREKHNEYDENGVLTNYGYFINYY